MYNRYSYIQLLGYGCVSSSLSAVVNAVRNGRWQLITVNATMVGLASPTAA